MKKLLFIAALFAANITTAQTIDTNSLKPYSVVKLQVPFAPKWGDTNKVSFMMVELKDDNLKNKATFRYVLFSKQGGAILDGYVPCEGEDYSGWDGNSKFPFSFVSNKIGLPIK